MAEAGLCELLCGVVDTEDATECGDGAAVYTASGGVNYDGEWCLM